MRPLQELPRLQTFFLAELDKTPAYVKQQSPTSNDRMIVVAASPQVTILPSADPYQQLPSLLISFLALVVAAYSLRRTLTQKQDEHRAKFFHDVVVDNGLVPMLRFFEKLQRFSEDESVKLIKSAGTHGHDDRVKQAMRKVRDMKVNVRLRHG
jgi:hypothetical protein